MSDPSDSIKPACPLFAEAFLNIDHRVFGLRMRPFCLWHSFLLHYHRSPVVFVELGRPTLRDVILAARIGTCRFGEWPAGATTFSVAGLRLAWASRGERGVRQALRLRDWMADHASGPDFWTPEKPVSAGFEPFKERGTMPPQLDTATKLILLGFSEREAWEMPLGKARWYAAAYAVTQGAELDFVEPLAPELEARIRADKAKFEAEQKAKAEAEAAESTDAGADGAAASE